ncbi:hypothetical protein [Flavobacterium sp. W22_SRS_FP1]|uniref:hypothetical protein n=1 Tax=Flavobacterium sp. W22_SRS_FP1 TaxID=3240276 RepID=UPI003F907CC4
MGDNNKIYVFINFFAPYGICAAANEGVSKSCISIIIDKKDMATAIGNFSAFQSVCDMLASSLTGIIWHHFRSNIPFMINGIGSVLILLLWPLNKINGI